MDLKELKGVGEKTAAVFAKAGIRTVEELLAYYPYRYEIYKEPVAVRDLKADGEMYAVRAVVLKRPVVKKTARMDLTIAEARDANGDTVRLIWYRMPYLANTLRPGGFYMFRGAVKARQGMTMEQPEVLSVDAYTEKMSHMQPVYHLVTGLTQNMVAKAVRQALDSRGIVTGNPAEGVRGKNGFETGNPAESVCGENSLTSGRRTAAFHGENSLVPENLPVSMREKYGLAEMNFAVEAIHFPKNMEAYAQARRRLVFEEFFLFLASLEAGKRGQKAESPHIIIRKRPETEQLLHSLPYELTKAQKRVWEEIRRDFAGPRPMSRLIQGDVGSGKTILAFLALAETVYNGYQGALMAPTEVLAAQHYRSAVEAFGAAGLTLNIVLLTGSMTKREKTAVTKQIVSGEADIIIGTHALIQETVAYKNLALVITDEQHRFGVRQRETLGTKGEEGAGVPPHVLVMSATPIPRTLALILYGDLDISAVDEMPAGRLPKKNCVVGESWRPRAWEFIKKQAALGHQSYVICPMVEESDKMEAENVTAYAEKLREAMPSGVTVGVLHGRMKPAEKNAHMRDFADGKITVLVSTTVVEVGVNVPNATVMVVENAERFGLAGLHQLRGRIGRGKDQGYCIFITATTKQETLERLDILNRSNDGFYIAEQDLKLRGPGDFFGVRQSGDFAFRIGDIYTDAALLSAASEAAKCWAAGQITCSAEEADRLQSRIERYQAEMTFAP
ncbi:MAG: ATP-dependent DNA helicase RecG [Lachnospiraceae bacterium]|nr:ATP-dependent DNA helicase RecG [Lachnospiraceae bacterium]